MKTFATTSLQIALQRVFASVVVMVLYSSVVSSSLAAGLPASGGNTQSLSPIELAQCEPQLAQDTPSTHQAMPPYASLASLRSDAGRYDLWRPAGWSVSGLGPTTIVLTPERQTQGARFSIQAMGTLDELISENLTWRSEWFDIGLHELPNAQVQWQSRWSAGNARGFEAIYTFHYNGDNPTLRWVRLIYVGTQEYSLVAEAPSTEEFESLQPMFNAMMVTFRPDDRADQTAADMCAS